MRVICAACRENVRANRGQQPLGDGRGGHCRTLEQQDQFVVNGRNRVRAAEIASHEQRELAQQRSGAGSAEFVPYDVDALRERGADDHAAGAGRDASLLRELLEGELTSEIVWWNERADQLAGR